MRIGVRRSRWFGFLLVATASVFSAYAEQSEAEKIEFFEKKVRPILVNNCYNCHSADTKAAGGLRVDDRTGLFAGGDTGPGVVPGEPEKSLIIRRVKNQDPKRRMPKDSEALASEDVETLTTWIKDGAAWPREKIPAMLGKTRPNYPELKSKHWAWQPIKSVKGPDVQKRAWAHGAIDQFVLAGLEAKKLAPVSDSSRQTLIRRLSFDLRGLPPTVEEIREFLNNRSRDAYANLVDRFLSSSQFGEQWGRHWLDVARYGESTGPSRNVPYPHAWKYRDYVIDAINRDVSFDRFITEQIAGDLLPATNSAERDRLLTATGFLALGVKDVNQRFKVRFTMDNVDEQIDAVSRGFLGLTVSCARCHDHKFDPIPTTDYYSLAGIFTSTDNAAGVRNKMGGGGLDYYDPAMLIKLASDDAPQPPKEKVEKLQAEVAEAKKAWDGIRGTPEGLKLAANGQPTQRPYRLKFERLQSELLSLTDPVSQGYAVHGVRDAKAIADTEVRIRGQAERLGPTVPRGFLTVFELPDAPTIGTNESGRLQLATWLTNPKNPLTSRVIANRIWQHLFGEGIVSTVDNFGINGDVPSHPELLDYLANEFVQNGWSTKKLVREIVLSRAYQLSSDGSEINHNIDPANRLIWRHSPRRLTAEEIRDSLLATGGTLELTRPQGSAAKELKMIEMRDNGKEARQIREEADRARYRSVYLPLLRGVTPSSLEAFDPVEQGLVTGKRDATTVPTQALFLLNSTFVREQSLALANRLDKSRASTEKRIDDTYLAVFGRNPTKAERNQARAFLKEYAATYDKTPHAVQVAFAPKEEVKSPKASTEVENPDDIDRTDEKVVEKSVVAESASSAAWMAFVQALYASAEFRFVR